MWNRSILKKMFLGLFLADLTVIPYAVLCGALSLNGAGIGLLFVFGAGLALCGRLWLEAPVARPEPTAGSEAPAGRYAAA